jgi:hypothetical protein
MNFTTLVEAGSIQQIFSQYRRLTSSADLRWKIENSSLTDWSAKKFTAKKLDSSYSLGPYRQDAIWQHDANFQFSMTFNFNIFQCFSNIRNHLSNFSYLVCISCKYVVLFVFENWKFASHCRIASDLCGPFYLSLRANKFAQWKTSF